LAVYFLLIAFTFTYTPQLAHSFTQTIIGLSKLIIPVFFLFTGGIILFILIAQTKNIFSF